MLASRGFLIVRRKLVVGRAKLPVAVKGISIAVPIVDPTDDLAFGEVDRAKDPQFESASSTTPSAAPSSEAR